jgi:hypothetical protein
MRKRAEESSEMVSQLLFGEQCEVLAVEPGDWAWVRGRKDGYEGWVDIKLIERTNQPYSEKNGKLYYSIEPSYALLGGDESRLITFGAFLPEFDGINLRLNGRKYTFSGQAARAGELPLTEKLVEKLCKKFLNAPYLWGGKTPFGVDCSGLVQMVFRVLGVDLPRDAKDQAKDGLTVDFVSECMSGDLAFFTKNTNRISHVGVILDDNEIIHASGRVRVDRLDHIGIFNREQNKYTHQLKIIKRVL